MRLAPLAVAGLLLVGAVAAPPASAQDSISTAASVAHFTPAQAAAFSKQIEDDLAARGARVAIVFRTGRAREKLPKGIGYTHGAFWVYRDIQTTGGQTAKGYAVYNLYAGDDHAWPGDESRLIQDFPIDFTRGSAVDDVAIIVPSPEMQRRILGVVDSPGYERLHNPSYSLIANPLSSKYQNCNDFMLDVVASAAWSISDIGQIRANERAHYPYGDRGRRIAALLRSHVRQAGEDRRSVRPAENGHLRIHGRLHAQEPPSGSGLHLQLPALKAGTAAPLAQRKGARAGARESENMLGTLA